MVATGFYERHPDLQVDLENTDPAAALPIGISQIGDPFLYYSILSLPLRLLHGASVTTQLTAGRLISLAFFLLTLAMAYLLVVELTPPGSALRWLVPAFLALLPGLVEFMTAFNNITAAVGLVSAWLWLAVRLVRRGPAWVELAALLALTWLCYQTQKTAWVVVLLLPVALALTVLRRRRWVLLPAGLLLGVILWQVAFANDDARWWIRRDYQMEPTRATGVWRGSQERFQQIAGKSGADRLQSAIQVRAVTEAEWEGTFPYTEAGVYQIIPIQESKKLQGKTATIGAWVWADRPTWVLGPRVNALCGFLDHWYGFPTYLWVTETPRFFATHILIPSGNCRLQFWLNSAIPDPPATMIYYTGLTLVQGFRPLDRMPVFTTPGGKKGRGDETFDNFVRNPFGQESWPRSQPWVEAGMLRALEGTTPSTPQSILSLFVDPGGAFWYISATTRIMFRSFWASFGWGQIELALNRALPVDIYVLLLWITLAGLAGSLLWLLRCRRSIPWAEAAFLLIAILGCLFLAYSYGLYTMGGALRYKAYLPMARYIYPVVIPLAFFLVSGWVEGYHWIRYVSRSPRWLGVALFFCFLIALDLYALFSVILYYYPPSG